jgi:hypothetical protein
MRRSSRALLVASLLALALAGATTAVAGENKNSVSFDIHCTADGAPVTFSGTLFGGAGSALHLEGGGISIAMGLKDVDGTIIVEPNPGLSAQGKLVECSFTIPGQPELIAFAFFAPPGTI